MREICPRTRLLSVILRLLTSESMSVRTLEGVHLMELVFSQIRYWVVTTTQFVPLLHEPTSQAGHHCRSEGLWLGCCLYFPFGSL